MTEPASRTADRAPASRDPTSLIGTVLAERYKIEELVGQGGMGTVYRAEHVHMKRTVALKVLHPEIAAVTEIAARFEREAIAVGRIEHRNVAKAMDFGRLPDGSFYLVVEYVKGERLTELIKRGPLAPVDALEIARQVADAIKAAHEAGVVHRDLKPDNVMIADHDGRRGVVKVLDFGVAKLATDEANTGSAITQYGAIVGTFTYMAPEQGGGGVVDHRADLYALGVIFYELLAGRPPFSSDDPLVMLSKHFVEPPPPLPPSITEQTAAIVYELLAKEPGARIQSAAELIARIDGAHAELGLTATESHPEPTIIDEPQTEHRAPSRAARRRRLSWPIAVATLALIGMIALAITLRRGERPDQAESTGIGQSDPKATAAPANAGQSDPKAANANAGQSDPKAATANVGQAAAPATATTEAVPIEAPAYEGIAAPRPSSTGSAKPTSTESEATKPSAQPEAVTPPASGTARTPKTVSSRRPGRRIIVRRTVVRRTTVTTTR